MVHIILACKYRKPLLTQLEGDIRKIIFDIAKTHQWAVLEMEADRDHIHILLQYHPTESIANVIRVIKQITTYRLWLLHGRYLKNNFGASARFGVMVISLQVLGRCRQKRLKKYIQNQG